MAEIVCPDDKNEKCAMNIPYFAINFSFGRDSFFYVIEHCLDMLFWEYS